MLQISLILKNSLSGWFEVLLDNERKINLIAFETNKSGTIEIKGKLGVVVLRVATATIAHKNHRLRGAELFLNCVLWLNK